MRVSFRESYRRSSDDLWFYVGDVPVAYIVKRKGTNMYVGGDRLPIAANEPPWPSRLGGRFGTNKVGSPLPDARLKMIKYLRTWYKNCVGITLPLWPTKSDDVEAESAP